MLADAAAGRTEVDAGRGYFGCLVIGVCPRHQRNKLSRIAGCSHKTETSSRLSGANGHGNSLTTLGCVISKLGCSKMGTIGCQEVVNVSWRECPDHGSWVPQRRQVFYLI